MKWTFVLGVCAVFCHVGLAQAQPVKSRLIEEENRKPGALDWQLTRVKLDKGMTSFRTSLIEGYCSHQSVQAGDTLNIMVSTAPAAKFKIEIFRTGYYQGRGARLMKTLGPLEGKPQPTPPVGERACANASGSRPPP